MRSRRKAKVSRSGWSRRVTLPIAEANVYVVAPLLARVLHFHWSTEGSRTRKLLNKILQIRLNLRDRQVANNRGLLRTFTFRACTAAHIENFGSPSRI
jgi:hypothetical protein